MKLNTIDIPPADSQSVVRHLLEAMKTSPQATVKALAEATRLSERHVRYRLQAASEGKTFPK